MKFSQSLILGFLIIVAISGAIGLISIYQFSTIIDTLKITVPESIENFKTNAIVLDNNRQIIYYDEILTQSARNYVFTQDEKWKKRYFETEPLLDKILKDPYSPIDKDIILELDKINIELVKMENTAFELVSQGNSEQAVEILESDEYTKLKQRYLDSWKHHAEINNVEYGNTIKSLDNTSDLLYASIEKGSKEGTAALQITVPVLVGLSILLGILFSKKLSAPIKDLRKLTKQIAVGNFDITIDAKGPDEIKELIQDFSQMVIELNKIDTMKKDFSAMVTHELKTPLVPILGYVDLLLSKKYGELNENQRERLIRIKNSCGKMQNLVSDMLDISRIEMKQFEFNMKINNLSVIVKDSVEQLKDEFLKKGICIIEEFENNTMCNCDKDRINQVMVNLLSNAIDFCPKKDGIIKVTVKKSTNKINIIVKDNGIGISKENINKIFVKYYQVDTTSTREHGGSGIGLALSKLIVENHRGKIWAESEGTNKGSEIHIQIPTI
ncbi:MAG: ATP-binding protein [Candidatus Nitrosopumilus sp. bin_7KS]